MKLLVTGANGFVGRALVPHLSTRGHQVVALEGPRGARRDADGTSFHPVDLAVGPDLMPLLAGIDTVVHLASKAHSRDTGTTAAFDDYRAANSDAVAHIATQAARSGVRRFILLSTIHVNGRGTNGAPFSEASPPCTVGAYETTKYEGEQRLIAAADEGSMQWCIIRSPLIVGGRAKANLASLTKLVGSGLPLPFRAIRNRRSLVGLANLCAFIERCAEHPKAANQLFLIADDPPLSTGQLAAALANALGRPARQFPLPRAVWTLAAAMPGVARRFGPLWESLEIDTAKARDVLDWRQPWPTASAIAEAVENHPA